VVAHIENAVEHMEIALRAFLDIERGFDRTSLQATERATEEHGVEPTIHKWISSKLERRKITTTLSGSS
jgi:hypothetical protein